MRAIPQPTTKDCCCVDPGCPACGGQCRALATMLLGRIDYGDTHATMPFCDGCGADALESGVFFSESDEDEEGSAD